MAATVWGRSREQMREIAAIGHAQHVHAVGVDLVAVGQFLDQSVKQVQVFLDLVRVDSQLLSMALG